MAGSPFRRYVRELRRLTSDSVRSGAIAYSDVDLVAGHLDGRANHELRDAISIADLRVLGAFFTGERLATRALSTANVEQADVIVDPACGCGDLLLAAAGRLPVEHELRSTLASWGRVLHGADVIPEFVEVAHYRLALLALRRGAAGMDGREIDVPSLFPNVVVGDGLALAATGRADLVLLNPPYGQVPAPAGCSFGRGLVSEAAIWVDAVLDQMSKGTAFVALLPDVLRSGSRYARWRRSVGARLEIGDLELAGQFDALTDVDIFVLDGRKSERGDGTWATDGRGDCRLADWCSVMVGSVVDGRDPHEGPHVPYVTTRELPLEGTFEPRRERAFAKRLFAPPFVVVRRTSRPSVGDQPRLRPVVVTGHRDVAVENHLLVLQPRVGGLGACLDLASRLRAPRVSDWLNLRIRLRHLTVGALRDLPLDEAVQGT